MVYSGMPLSQIAGLDSVQLEHIVFRPRNKHGALKRGNGLPPGVHVDEDGMRVVKNAVGYERAFREAGGSEEKWKEFVADNPYWNTNRGRR